MKKIPIYENILMLKHTTFDQMANDFAANLEHDTDLEKGNMLIFDFAEIANQNKYALPAFIDCLKKYHLESTCYKGTYYVVKRI